MQDLKVTKTLSRTCQPLVEIQNSWEWPIRSKIEAGPAIKSSREAEISSKLLKDSQLLKDSRGLEAINKRARIFKKVATKKKSDLQSIQGAALSTLKNKENAAEKAASSIDDSRSQCDLNKNMLSKTICTETNKTVPEYFLVTLKISPNKYREYKHNSLRHLYLKAKPCFEEKPYISKCPNKAKFLAANAYKPENCRGSTNINVASAKSKSLVESSHRQIPVFIPTFDNYIANYVLEKQGPFTTLVQWMKKSSKSANVQEQARNFENFSKIDQRHRQDFNNNFACNKYDCNYILMHGHTSTGKSYSIKLAAELFGYEIIELNSADLRSGKNILEAFKIASQTFSITIGQKAAISNNQSIFLLEDVDCVYSCDQGFWSAVSNLIKISKRPIIMTCTNLELVKKNFNALNVLEFSKLSWQEAFNLFKGYLAQFSQNFDWQNVAKIQNFYSNDMRKISMHIWFWCSTASSLSLASDFYVYNKGFADALKQSETLHSLQDSLIYSDSILQDLMSMGVPIEHIILPKCNLSLSSNNLNKHKHITELKSDKANKLNYSFYIAENLTIHVKHLEVLAILDRNTGILGNTDIIQNHKSLNITGCTMISDIEQIRPCKNLENDILEQFCSTMIEERFSWRENSAIETSDYIPDIERSYDTRQYKDLIIDLCYQEHYNVEKNRPKRDEIIYNLLQGGVLALQTTTQICTFNSEIIPYLLSVAKNSKIYKSQIIAKRKSILSMATNHVNSLTSLKNIFTSAEIYKDIESLKCIF